MFQLVMMVAVEPTVTKNVLRNVLTVIRPMVVRNVPWATMEKPANHALKAAQCFMVAIQVAYVLNAGLEGGAQTVITNVGFVVLSVVIETLESVQNNHLQHR